QAAPLALIRTIHSSGTSTSHSRQERLLYCRASSEAALCDEKLPHAVLVQCYTQSRPVGYVDQAIRLRLEPLHSEVVPQRGILHAVLKEKGGWCCREPVNASCHAYRSFVTVINDSSSRVLHLPADD